MNIAVMEVHFKRDMTNPLIKVKPALV